MNEPERDAWQRAVRLAGEHQSVWRLPDLVHPDPVDAVQALLVRYRALTLIERDLVGVQVQRRRRAPFSDEWAHEWFERVVIPSARRKNAMWWLLRAPRRARSWAIALDPEGAFKASEEKTHE